MMTEYEYDRRRWAAVRELVRCAEQATLASGDALAPALQATTAAIAELRRWGVPQ